MAEIEEELKNLLMKVKGQSEKDSLNFNIQTAKIMASSPITSENRWGYSGNSERLFSWAPKLLHLVTAAMNIKDVCSLKVKL